MESQSAFVTVSKNGAINLFGALWQFLLVIAGTTMILPMLGVERFGLLAMVGGVTGYFIYLDMSFSDTIIKKISEASDNSSRSKVISSLLIFAICVGLFASTLGILFALYGVPMLFNMAEGLSKDFSAMLMVIAAYLWILIPMNMFGKVLIGMQRLDLYNILRIIFQTAMLAAILIAAKNGDPVKVILAMTLVGLCWKLATLFVMRRQFPQIEVSFKFFSKKLLRSMLRFEAKVFTARLAGQTVNQCDLYIIGIFIGPSAVATYAIANIIAIKLSEAAGVIGTALYPVLSKMYGNQQQQRIARGYLLSLRAMLFIMTPISIFFIAYAGDIINLWVGSGMAAAEQPMKLLSIAWLFAAGSLVATITLKSINHAGLEAKWAIIIATINVLLDLLVIKQFGISGVVWVTMFCQIIGFLYISFRTGRLLGLGSSAISSSLLKPLIPSLAALPIYLIPLPLQIFFLHPILHLATAALIYHQMAGKEERLYLKEAIARFTRRG